VLDVGANEGSFSAAILELAPAATIVAVEPAPGPRARLEARFGDRITIVPKAMAAQSGSATLHITAHDHNSSLRAPRAEMVSTYHDIGWAVREDIEVPTTSLDDLVGDRAVSVLKLDVQGGELAVLQGGRQALGKTSAVLIEVTFFSHYEGDATFGPLHDEMTRLGFVLTAMSEPGRTEDGRATWADACYTPSDRG
jgi:FkbM family methyltransferase